MTNRHLVALVVVAAAVVVTSASFGHRLPLYDGVSAPDEPYRYVDKPGTPAPTAAQDTFSAAEVPKNYFDTVSTKEVGPQASVYLYAHRLNVPSKATSVTVRLTPEAPDHNQPAHGVQAGNLYRFAVTTDAGPPTYNKNDAAQSEIDLRLPQGYAPGATIAYRPEAHAKWSALPTQQVGNDIYEAPLAGFGDYTLVAGQTAQGAQSAKHLRIAIATALLIAIFIGLLFIIRLHAASEEGDEAGDSR